MQAVGGLAHGVGAKAAIAAVATVGVVTDTGFTGDVTKASEIISNGAFQLLIEITVCLLKECLSQYFQYFG